MKAEMLLKAMSAIDDEDIRAANEYRRPTISRKGKRGLIAACFVLCIAVCGTAGAMGLISFDWVEKIFGAGEQNAILQGHILSVDKSNISGGITIELNSIVSDGASIYADFSIDTLSDREVRNDLNFQIRVPAVYNYSHGGTLTQIEKDGPNSEDNAREYIFRDTISGLRESLLGKTITLTVEHYVTHENYEDGKIESELANEWVFEIELNDTLEAVGYTMGDGTPVTVTPIAVYLEWADFFARPKADFKIEMTDGSMIDLTDWQSNKRGHVDENGKLVHDYVLSSIMLTEIIDPKDAAAIWVKDTRYELTATNDIVELFQP
ncbi:MAG TPA: DUF4179 domain-containing protein [Clostridia bacterium]|nr:DUF4179 domain-containing protein [Clostridia bacterium]